MSDETEAQTIARYATVAADVQPIGDDGRFFVVNHPVSGVRVIDLEVERDSHMTLPLRKAGTVRVTDAASLIAYLDKHARPETEVWADAASSTIVAVIDAHGRDEHQANWEDHRAVLSVRHTDAWMAWARHDGQLLDQSTFAEHIEDRVADIVRPAGADMLELAQTIEATVGVAFESSKLLSSGERQLSYREKVEARGGRAGQLEIPRDFEIGVAPYEGSPAYRINARFRYRINNGTLQLGYRLDRPNDVLRNAFLDVVADVNTGVDAPIFNGVPA